MNPAADKDTGDLQPRGKRKASVDLPTAASLADLAPARQALRALTGAKLCYGKPIKQGGRTIVPVASVRTAGGFGFGKAGRDAEPDGSSGGGGGGAIDARPVGFIEIGPEGARFQPINDRRLPLAAIAGGAGAALMLARLLARRRRGRLQLPRPLPRLPRRRPAELPLPR
jgi:uncharacterized spore protein YtfJ